MRNNRIKADRCALYAPDRNRNIYTCYINDFLLPEEKEKFEKHLEECPICTKAVVEAINIDKAARQSILLSENGLKRSLKRRLQYLEELIGNNTVSQVEQKKPSIAARIGSWIYDQTPVEMPALAASISPSIMRQPYRSGIAFGVAVDDNTGQGSLLECTAIVKDKSKLKNKLEIRIRELKSISTEKDQIERKITTPSDRLEEIFADVFSLYEPLNHLRLFDKTIRVEITVKEGCGYISEGDSSALAIMISILSEVTNMPIYDNILFSAGIDIRGYLKAVGSLDYKIDLARKHNIGKCFIASENNPELKGKTLHKNGVDLYFFETLEDVMKHMGFIPVKKNSLNHENPAIVPMSKTKISRSSLKPKKKNPSKKKGLSTKISGSESD